MRLLNRPLRAGGAAVLGLATIALTGAFASSAGAASTSGPRFTAMKDSVAATTDARTGAFNSAKMSIEVALAPRNANALTAQLRAVYTPRSHVYHRWLARGEFDARYAPSAAQRAAVANYLRSSGLSVTASKSPFLVRATGSATQIESAFRTSLSTYRDPKGINYFANSTPVQLPATIAGDALGVIGLTNTAQQHMMIARPSGHAMKSAKKAAASCQETPYPTTAQLFAQQAGTGFPYGYGAGPGCSGLTPAQTNSIYGAPHAGPRAEGAGTTAAVFELSAYQHSDIATWAHQFYGSGYTPRLVDENVDGSPLNPMCPAGDTCPPDINGYSGDIEVDADIQMELTLAPDVSHVIVYNAPNDFSGQTELDEYTQIANDDTADTVSSSWAVCENDLASGYVQAENVVFEQMALQGQSMFGAGGDSGAFGCIRSDGTTIANTLDPPSQPWVTNVGGTSLESDNPGNNQHPGYPANGTETVWNVDNLCSNQAPNPANDNQGGFFWCNATGAGGGGSSQWWGRPFYQLGPGVNNHVAPQSCALASPGSPCREVPDVSANADEFTGYAEFCTGNASTPFSTCATITGQPAPGWFQIGGTSLAAPLWASLITDRDSFQGHRTGNINPLVYLLFNLNPNRYFHDQTGNGQLQQAATNNGLFPVTPGYDEATGIGSPKMAAIITGF